MRANRHLYLSTLTDLSSMYVVGAFDVAECASWLQTHLLLAVSVLATAELSNRS